MSQRCFPKPYFRLLKMQAVWIMEVQAARRHVSMSVRGRVQRGYAQHTVIPAELMNENAFDYHAYCYCNDRKGKEYAV